MTHEEQAITKLANWKHERHDYSVDLDTCKKWAVSEYWATVRDMTVALVAKHGWDFANLNIKAHELAQKTIKGMGVEDG